MMNIAIIPARGGSQRIPRKNVRPFFGKPILAYSIEAAQASKLFARIYVSTDDPMIGTAALHYGALPVLRARALARDEVGTQEVARSVVEVVPNARYACCIYATAPLMNAQDLRLGFGILVNSGLNFIYSAGPDGTDAGQWYWGTREAFIEREPLTGPRAGTFTLPAERVCDINVEDDWKRAETMFESLRRKP